MNRIQQIIETVINEYLTREGVSLLKYFNLSEEEIKKILPHEYYYLFDDFLKKHYRSFGYIPNEFYDTYKKLKNDNKYDDYKIINYVFENNKDVFYKFSDYLFNGVENQSLSIPFAEYPAWSFFGKPQIIKNQWLIHQTHNADDIAKEGFKYGIHDQTKLGLTTHLNDFEKQFGGYNFAYTLNDFLKYGKIGSRYKYGEEAVVFIGSGIRLWHYLDEEYQTIFYGNTAKNIIPITHYGITYDIHSVKTNKIIYKAETMEQAVRWIIDNFNQYRKHLIK